MTPRPAARGGRRALFRLHSWVGFHLAFLTLLVVASGTLATLADEADWLLHPEMRVTPGEQIVSFGVMQRAVEDFAPQGTVVRLQKIGGERFAWRADVWDEYGRRRFVHVDPYTGEVTGQTHLVTVQRVLRDFHRYLFLPAAIGLPLVTVIAVVLAVSLYTGLKTARNWRTLLFRLRTHKGARVMVGDAHKAAGLWASWFFVLIALTGFWYFAEFVAEAGGEGFEPERPGIGIEAAAASGPLLRVRDFGEAADAARAAYPELDVTEIMAPYTVDGSFIVMGRIGNPLLRDRANRVFLAPETLEVLHVQRSDEIGLTAWINETADQLHFGSFGGLTTQILWFAFGLVLTGLSGTGVWLTWRRLGTVRPTRTQAATLPLLVLVGFAGTAWFARFDGPSVPADERRFAPILLADGIVADIGILAGGEGGADRARISIGAASGAPNLACVTLKVGDEGSERCTRDFRRRHDIRFDLPAEGRGAEVPLTLTFALRGEAPSTYVLRPGEGTAQFSPPMPLPVAINSH